MAREAIRDMERNLILEALRANQWNRRRAAVALKISYRALIYEIRDAGLISGRSKLSTDSQVGNNGTSLSSAD
jgi:two-component system response regulator AtoC